MLSEIIEAKRMEVKALPFIEQHNVDRYSLLESLRKPNRSLGLIAEVKKASPSKGVINANFDPVNIAKQYQQGGADALSVLTDENFFQGHHTFLSKIKTKVELPVLRKDFIISEKQIEQSLRMGADAILLIATILEKNQLHEFYLETYERGMECLVEVHDMGDLETVLSTFTPKIIGINNRNLKTFKTNINQTFEIANQLPKGMCVVSESGIKEPKHIKQLNGFANAILVGETLMRAPNPLVGIKTLFGD